MTTNEAAAILNVSIQRVRQLIKSGSLKAMPFKKNHACIEWIVDEQSVRNRKKYPMPPGNPLNKICKLCKKVIPTERNTRNPKIKSCSVECASELKRIGIMGSRFNNKPT